MAEPKLRPPENHLRGCFHSHCKLPPKKRRALHERSALSTESANDGGHQRCGGLSFSFSLFFSLFFAGLLFFGGGGAGPAFSPASFFCNLFCCLVCFFFDRCSCFFWFFCCLCFF